MSDGMKTEQKRNQYISAIMGLVVGDALGVPAEFMSRAELKEHPITGMVGYGTHGQPAGTWSDDSSMTIATVEWFGERGELPLDYEALMEKFCSWLMHGEYTPYGTNFDNGIATSRALMRYGKGMEPLQCGGRAENENGNGSLMRILPAALWFHEGLAKDGLEHAEDIFALSALTHAHRRSKLGCLIYAKLIADLMQTPDADKREIAERSLMQCKAYLDGRMEEDIPEETEQYSRLWDVEAFRQLPEEEIRSSGYVVDTLEAALWCFLNTDSYPECVLRAVNLGEDTDTVGAVAGGLAGLYYGLESVPKEWRDVIPKWDWIVGLVEKMVESGEEG